MIRRSNRFTRAVRSWLELERAGSHGRAESELFRAFSLLVRPVPSPMLVEETMRRLGIAFRGRAVAAPSRAFKIVVGACLTAAGAALVIVPSILLPWITALRPALVVQWWTSVLVGLSQRLASGFAVWKVLAAIGNAVADTLASPEALALLGASLIVSFVTFRALSGLVSFERGTRNV